MTTVYLVQFYFVGKCIEDYDVDTIGIHATAEGGMQHANRFAAERGHGTLNWQKDANEDGAEARLQDGWYHVAAYQIES